MKLKNRKRFFSFLFVVIVLEIAILVLLFGGRKVVDTVTMEAGSVLPEISLFLENPNKEASFVTDMSSIPVSSPGVYEIEIRVGRKNYKSFLHIIDTIAPKGTVRKIDLIEAGEIKPEDFFESIEDATNVKVTYKTAPDMTKQNEQPVVLVLTDASGNTAEYETVLRISKAVDNVQVEAGTEALSAAAFLKTGVSAGKLALAGEAPTLDKVGSYPVIIHIDGVDYNSTVQVVDTIPPAATAVNQTGWVGEAIEASAFVNDIVDKTGVTVTYEVNPDFNLDGEQTVTLILEDEGGNKTSLQSSLTLLVDTEPPKIYGAKTSTAYIGQPVSYKKGVYAEDNKDGEVAISVDSSQVNLKVEGDYPVYYSAVDSSGNKAEVEITITVKEQTVTMDELNQLADEVLAKITTEDMTVLEKSWAIYKYVNTHLTYTGVSDKTDWMKEAKNGIVRAVGDCFTYYSMSQLLLTRIGGVEMLSVQRASIGDETRHYWHMVNFGEGWYHFDACIHRPKLVSFMLTTEELDAFSRRVGKNEYYYRYDKESYPETEEKPTEEILALRALN